MNSFSIPKLACGLLTSALLASCAGAKRPQPEIVSSSGYQVTVRADGKPVKNFEAELVHRISLRMEDVRALQQAWGSPQLRSVYAVADVDKRGDFMGLRVRSIHEVKSLPSLGLVVGDYITAVNHKRDIHDDSLLLLFDSIATLGEGTLTLERDHESHKIIYTLVGRPSRLSDDS